MKKKKKAWNGISASRGGGSEKWPFAPPPPFDEKKLHIIFAKQQLKSRPLAGEPLFQPPTPLAGVVGAHPPPPPSGQVPPALPAGSDMIRWSRVLLCHTLDAARSY